MFRVYKIISKINGKVYFGYTGQTLQSRFNGHCDKSNDTLIARSIRKYGKENFIMELVQEFVSEEKAKQKEMEMIAEFQTNIVRFPQGNGLNMTDGGEGARGYKHTGELKERWKRERAGIKRSPESTTKQSKSLSKPVYQFTTDGELIAVFESTISTATALGCDPGNLSRCCNGNIKTIRGFIFQYEAEFIPRDLSRKKSSNAIGEKNVRARSCYLFDSNGMLLRTYGSVSDVSREFNISLRTCLSALRSKSHIFQDMYFLSYSVTLVSDTTREYHNYIQQLDIGTGEVINTFRSIVEACNVTGIKRSGIDKCLMGMYHSSGGYIWRRVK